MGFEVLAQGAGSGRFLDAFDDSGAVPVVPVGGPLHGGGPAAVGGPPRGPQPHQFLDHPRVPQPALRQLRVVELDVHPPDPADQPVQELPRDRDGEGRVVDLGRPQPRRRRSFSARSGLGQVGDLLGEPGDGAGQRLHVLPQRRHIGRGQGVLQPVDLPGQRGDRVRRYRRGCPAPRAGWWGQLRHRPGPPQRPGRARARTSDRGIRRRPGPVRRRPSRAAPAGRRAGARPSGPCRRRPGWRAG